MPNALIRALWPDFDPGATVEEAGISPSPCPPVDMAEVEAALVLILGEPDADAEPVDADAPLS